MVHNRIHFSKLLVKLGYCSRKEVKKFIANNKILLNDKPLPPQFKLKTYVDPRQITLNDAPIPYLDFNLHVLFNKAVGVSCYPTHVMQHRNSMQYGEEEEEYSDEEEIDDSNGEKEQEYFQYEQELSESSSSEPSIFDFLPETFLHRRPAFNIAAELPLDISGLTFITQDYELKKAFTSVRNPLSRIYEVQLRDDFTGLEQDALRTLRGEIKPSVKKVINAPKFSVVNESERIAHITLNDYKPDKVLETILSIRHEPLYVKKIAIGHLQLANQYLNDGCVGEFDDRIVLDLKENDWCTLNDMQIKYLLLDKKIQNERRTIIIQRIKQNQQKEASKEEKKTKSDNEIIRKGVEKLNNLIAETLFATPIEEYDAKYIFGKGELEYEKKKEELKKMSPEKREEELAKMAKETEKIVEEIRKKREEKQKKKATFKPIIPDTPYTDLKNIFKDESLDPNKLGKL